MVSFQNIFQKLRINIFESPKFYYNVLLILLSHLVLKQIALKLLLSNSYDGFIELKYLSIFLYGLTYVFCLISVILLYKKVARVLLITWLVIFSVSIINEFLFYKNTMLINELIYSASYGQGFRNIKVSLPLLFIAIWEALNCNTKLSKNVLKITSFVVVINVILIYIGLFFDFEIFKSYPLSERWGYSGILSRGHNIILTTIILIEFLQKPNRPLILKIIFLSSLLLTGTKAGILSFILILFFLIVKSKSIKLLMIGLIVVLISTTSKWIGWLVRFDPFWRNVYENHGGFGVLFSLRNESLLELIEIMKSSYNFKDWVLGGKVRVDELWVEIIPIDVLAFYGIVGVFAFYFFFKFMFSSWNVVIPVIVAFSSGALFGAPYSFIIWGIWAIRRKNAFNL